MKTKETKGSLMKRILKFIGCLALGCVGLTTLAATTQVADQDALNTAVANAAVGDVVEITAAGTYTMPNVPQNITIQAKAGVDVLFNCAGSGSICSIPNGAKFVNVAFSMGGNKYHGWQHPGALEFEGCKFEGMFFSYGKMTFTGCTFNQTAKEYHMWDYGGELTFMDCVFNGKGKFLNVYNEGNDDGSPWILTMTRCKFCSDTKNKAALNVKSTSTTAGGVVTALKYTVDIEGCSFEGEFPSASTSDSLIVFNELVQLDDIKPAYPNTISITQDGRVIYKENAPIPEPITVTVVKNEEKGVTQEVVTEIAGNKEVGKLEETGLKEALPAEELEEGGEPVIKVQLQEVAANTLKFDVSPYVGEKKVDSNTLNGKPVAVRLPLVAAEFNGEYAKIIHGSDPVQFVLVKTGTTGKYVDLTLTHFSEVDLLLANAEEIVKAVDPSAVEIQTGLWGDKNTLDDADIVYIVGKTGLEAFRDWVNDNHSGEGKTFQLVADVDLGNENWTVGIGDRAGGDCFKGTFDGQGKTVDGLYITGATEYTGLFGSIKCPAVVKNLTVRGEITDSTEAGGIVGIMDDGGKLLNLTNYVNVTTSKKAAGIVGSTRNMAEVDMDHQDDMHVAVVKNCVNYGTVTQITKSNQAAGGITAWVAGYSNGEGVQLYSAAAVFEDCSNFGEVTSATGSRAGGIVGLYNETWESGWVRTVRCYNAGKIVGPDNQGSGGIMGQFGANQVKAYAYFEECVNDGDVPGANLCGGLVGSFNTSPVSCKDAYVVNYAAVKSGQKIAQSGYLHLVSMIADSEHDIYYTSIADAIAAAKDGDTVTLVSASSENFTLPVGVTFDASKAAYSGTISAPEGYFVKEIASKVYACQPLVAKIGDKPFSSLAEAVAAATTSDTIALFADLADVGNISLPAGVTIDGQDHQISGGSSVYVAAGGGTVQNIAFRNIHNEGNTRSAVYAESLTGTLVVQGCAFDNVDWDAIQIVPKYVGNKSESTADIKIVDNEFRHTDAESTMGAYVHIEQSADDRQDAGLKLSGLTITDNRFYKSANAVDDGMASIGTEEHINKTLVSGKFAYFGGNWFEDASSAVLPTGAIIYPARSQADVDVDDLACVLTADGVSKGYTLSEAVAKANEMTTESGVITIDVYSQSLTVTEPVEINNPNGSFIKITCNDMIVTPAGDQVKGKLIADGCDALHFASKGSYFGKIECTEVSKNAISTTGSGEVFVYIAKSTITGEVVSKGGYQGAVEIFPENGALFDRDTYSFFDSVRRHTLVPIEQEDGTWITTKIDDSKAVSLGYKFKSKSMTVTNEADAVFGKHGLYMSHYYAKLTEVYEHSKMTFGTGSTNYKNLTLLDNLVIGEGEGKVATGTTISTDAYSISGSIVSDGSLTITDTKSTPHSINLGNVVATTLTLGATKTYKAPYAITNATVSTKLVVNACCNPLEVFGGTFKALDVKSGATVEISGGTWGSDPSAYVKTGYETVTNSGDLVTYSVYPAGIVALVGDTPYYNLADAFAAGAEAEEKTVKLYKDTDENAMIPLGVQFNTNGKTYTGKLTAPDGYAVTELSPGVYGVGVTVAMIGDDRYATLTEAFEAAQDGDTVLLSPMIIDAKAQNVLSKLAKKKVTVKGAGMDKTELLFGDGYKAVADTEACYGEFSDTDFVFENMAITIDHDNGGSSLNPKSQPEPYCQYIKNPVSQTFRNVKFNGEIVVAKKAVFDGCTFTGARLNTYKGADDEYLVWLYGGEMLITNCTFTGTGTHGPVKLNCPNAKACDVTIVDCRFEKIGTEGGIITPSCGQKDLVYDVQIDLDTVEIPENACYVGTKIAQWPAGGVAIVNGTKNKDGKYVSGAAFTEKGTDADVNACVAKVIGPDSVCLAYIGPATVLGNFRWYIGDKQLTPKTDNVEVGGLPENPSDEIKQQVAVNTNNVIKTLSSDDITKFADTDVAGSSFKADGTPKTEVKQALIAAASEQAVKDAIAAQLGESNSNERVEIKLEKFNFTVQDQSATLSVVEYDVKPWIKVTTIVDDVETVTEAVIPNLALKGHPLTFRLAVNDNFGQYAKVIHMDEGAVLETYLTEVFTGATGKYVQLKSDHFSNFFLSADVTEPKCKVGDQFYDSVQKAIEGNANVPDAVFTLTAPCGETELPLLWGQEIDVNGQEFTGSIIPVNPAGESALETYEQVKTPEGRVFSAPRQVAVPLDASDDSSKIKIRIAGKDAEALAAAQPSGRPLWQDLAMGSTVKLIPQVLRSAIGSNVITIRGNISDEDVEAAAKLRDGVSVKYQLQKKVGAGSYVQFGEIQPTPVFTVGASQLEVQTFWKIQTIFSEEY